MNTPSLRSRLVAVLVLAVIACAASLLAVLHLSRTGEQQRLERAEDLVEREVERVRDDPPGPHFRDGRRPRVLTGTLSADFFSRDPRPYPQAFVDARRDAAVAASRSGRIEIRAVEAMRRGLARRRAMEGDDPDPMSTVVVAVMPRTDGYAWAATWVLRPPGERVWRAGALILALATLGLVAVALHTLFALRRGAHQLDASLRTLARDLGAPMERPSVPELAMVSDGIASLAQALQRSNDEGVRLQRELAGRERLASLGRVAAGIAHEVRNPMASIKLRVDLSKQSVLRPGADLAGIAADLSEVGDEIARLDRLVADLLVISGRRLGTVRDTDLRALAEQRVALLDAMAADRRVAVTVAGDARAEVDPDGVTRVLDNLLRNAIEASPEGGAVQVRLADEGARVFVRVCDGGEGVPAGRERELFEPFFTTKGEGTGLGLALSRAVAEAHGGGLRYRREGAVTVFEAELPRRAKKES